MSSNSARVIGDHYEENYLCLRVFGSYNRGSCLGPGWCCVCSSPRAVIRYLFSDNADKGFAGAKTRCAENGTLPSDCLRVKWCYPAGWSADIFLQHKEGIHWHEYHCGWSSREDVEAAVKLSCEGSQKEWLIECAMVGLWNPDGQKQSITPGSE